MKKRSLTSKIAAGILIIPAVAAVFSLGSCQKKEELGKPAPASAAVQNSRSVKMRTSVAKVLRDFALATSGGSSSSTTSGGGSSTYSNPALSYTTYSTSGATVYSWSDPTTGTSYTLTESTSSGNGIGQLSYNGKSFDYNYVLSIKASANDPSWTGFFNGRDLRGVVAIDGAVTGTDFTLKNIAFFFVATTGGSGSYKLIDFGSNTVAMTDGLGEIIDLSDAPDGTTLSGLGSLGKIYVTAGGHIDVSDSEFSMESDAKVMEVTTSSKFTLDGSIMLL